MTAFDTVIIGGGPAGLSAAIYAGAEGLRSLCLADKWGGQAGTSSCIENLMGFPRGVSGPALTSRAKRQAEKMGCTIGQCHVASVEHHPTGFLVRTDSGDVIARSVIVATGAKYNRLPDATGAHRYESGGGVHYAATSREVNGHRNAEAIVIGGGNSAGQAANYLRKFRREVHLLVRGDSLLHTMSHYLITRLEAAGNVKIRPHSELAKLYGESRVEAASVRCRLSGAEEYRPINDLFVMIGATPNTAFLDPLGAARDEHGFLIADALKATSVPGLFAVGDVRSGSVKRVATAVGEGAIAVSAVHDFLNS